MGKTVIPNRKSKRTKDVDHTELTDEQIRDWMDRAAIREINIFDDHNQIIKVLCRALLEARGEDPFMPRDTKRGRRRE